MIYNCEKHWNSYVSVWRRVFFVTLRSLILSLFQVICVESKARKAIEKWLIVVIRLKREPNAELLLTLKVERPVPFEAGRSKKSHCELSSLQRFGVFLCESGKPFEAFLVYSVRVFGIQNVQFS